MRKKTSILTVSLLCLMLVSPLAEAAKQSKAQTEDADTYELLNLFGEQYDSRLLMGRDILSTSPGLVLFNNARCFGQKAD